MLFTCSILLAMVLRIRASELRGEGGEGAAPPHDSKELGRSETTTRSLSSSLPPDYFEKLRRNAVNVTRIGQVEVAETEEGELLAFCHIPYFFPFSHFPIETEPRQVLNIQGPLEGAAAIYLAMKHLNTGDGSVIPEVEGLDETCNVRFTFEMSDTEFWENGKK